MESSPRHNLLLWLPLALPLAATDADTLRHAIDRTTQELTVFIALTEATNIAADSSSSGWSHMQRRIAELYAIAASHLHQRQRSSLTVDIVPLDFCAYTPEDMNPFKHDPTLLQSPDAKLPAWWPREMHTGGSAQRTVGQSTKTAAPWKSFAHVAVGGTFDHLHVGHKILLTATALAATKRIVCGISADALLDNKRYKEYLESYRARELNVLLFLRKIRKNIIVELVPIVDRYGPTITDPTIGALVVSQETLPGSDALNVRREELGMPPMHLLPIDLVAATGLTTGDDGHLKISSTAIRAALAERH
ncbi:hypothetical protein IWW57_004582 [Coemansia sp. S610]|uniref:Uncharacterized protein n=1 Tax=Coemansia linderi TaxID=2663919 RepID=A0ACC1KG11_9FUNG|nr:hypothetical protein IWW57_004582 [Coemansia sp. S610]KAJ2412827.1 hypothetical protein GGI10_003447 [Coemansia sp. RSA 2530]KAJ2695699.1 hypothetical protein H4218_005115 [Coemansia sp. IMI 209128]KAJ2789467.1 hypothetical protein GGI18_002386 [Coemansia linderi]